MRTYLTNCILTFASGPQVFRDIPVPLEAGEETCRVFFQGIAEALRPTRAHTLRVKGMDVPQLALPRDVADNALVKVSMCATAPEGMVVADMDTLPALAWFNTGNGKLYFGEWDK